MGNVRLRVEPAQRQPHAVGAASLAEMAPSTDPNVVVAAQEATSETVTFLERHPLFPLRAGESLVEALDALDVIGRPLEPLQLRMLADFVDSVEQSRAGIARAGADFAEIARQHSTCPSSRDGGNLGSFGRGQMVKEFDTVVFSAPLNVVQGPVKTQFGYHLLEVTSRQD